MPAKPDKETAELNAELAAAHAEAAAEAASQAERELAEATKEDPKARICPNCNSEMQRHAMDHPHHPGYWHCLGGCGACLPPGFRNPS